MKILILIYLIHLINFTRGKMGDQVVDRYGDPVITGKTYNLRFESKDGDGPCIGIEMYFKWDYLVMASLKQMHGSKIKFYDLQYPEEKERNLFESRCNGTDGCGIYMKVNGHSKEPGKLCNSDGGVYLCTDEFGLLWDFDAAISNNTYHVHVSSRNNYVVCSTITEWSNVEWLKIVEQDRCPVKQRRSNFRIEPVDI